MLRTCNTQECSRFSQYNLGSKVVVFARKKKKIPDISKQQRGEGFKREGEEEVDRVATQSHFEKQN